MGPSCYYMYQLWRPVYYFIICTNISVDIFIETVCSVEFNYKEGFLFSAPVVGALRGGVVPCIRSMLSKLTLAGKQGVILSAVLHSQ